MPSAVPEHHPGCRQADPRKVHPAVTVQIEHDMVIPEERIISPGERCGVRKGIDDREVRGDSKYDREPHVKTSGWLTNRESSLRRA